MNTINSDIKNNIDYVNSLNLKLKLSKTIVNNIISKIKTFNWLKDDNLIKLRQQGYIPCKQKNNYNFNPKPMRIKPRIEVRNTLTKLAITLVANSDYYINNQYLFEVMVSFQCIAQTMGMLRTYKNGRISYDGPLHSLHILEQLNYVIVYRSKNYIRKRNKPIRIWLTKKFFNSLGIPTKLLRIWLYDYKYWIIKNNLINYYNNKYLIYINKIKKINIDIDNQFDIQDKLINIKNTILKNKYNFYKYKNNTFNKKKINTKISNNKNFIKSKKNNLNNKINTKILINKNFIKSKKNTFQSNINNLSNYYKNKYIQYTTSDIFTVPEVLLFEQKYSNYFLKLYNINPESWYKFIYFNIKRYKKININKFANYG